MNREQVFLAVLTGVVACGPKFKARQPGQCGSPEVDYDKMIKITENLTGAVMQKHSLGDPMIRVERERDLLRNSYDELKEKVIRLERELQASNQAIAAAGTRPTWHHLREVEAKLRDAMMKCAAFDKECQNKDADLCRLQADKDALRKAVEDGAMEIERLTNTLKGVEQIASMKQEDVEMLAKYAQAGCGWAPNMLNDSESRLFRPLPQTEIKTWGNDRGTLAVDPVIDIKNDLSSAVANSTEGQRVVVEDLEATVDVGLDPEEWVMITDHEHIIRECDWLGAKNSHESFITAKRGNAVGKKAGIYIAEPDQMFLRCRRKDLPVVEVKDAPVSSVTAAENPEEWVQILDPDHVLREDDQMTAMGNRNLTKDWLQSSRCGWGTCQYYGYVGRKAGNHMVPDGFCFRCKRKDLPVTPPATESQS